MFQNSFRVAVLALAIFQTDGLCATESVSMVPIVMVETPRQVFDDVMRGELITETFTIKNVGKSPLRFKGVEMSHPGMKIRVKQFIEPGSQVSATIEWDTNGIAGDMRGVAVLLTNDPMQPRVDLILEGKIIPPIQVLPRPVFYLSVFQGEHASVEFTIQNNQEKHIRIERLELLGSHFKAKTETKTEGKQWGLVVSVPTDTPIGRYREALKIHTDDEGARPIHVQVNILVKPDVFINPETIDFGRISQARIESNPQLLEFLTQTLVINRRVGAMVIEDIKSPLKFIEVDVTPEGESSAFQLFVKIDHESLVTGRFDDRITLLTDDPDSAEINIPVKGEILE